MGALRQLKLAASGTNEKKELRTKNSREAAIAN